MKNYNARRLAPAYFDGMRRRLLKPLDCGHRIDADTAAKMWQALNDRTYVVSTGYALVSSDEPGPVNLMQTACYSCADARMRAEMADARVFSAYVSEARREITTWTGGTLARITSLHTARSGWAGVMRYVTAVTPDGAVWHGKGGADMDLVTLRRKA